MTRKEEIKEKIRQLENELQVIENEEAEACRKNRWYHGRFCGACRNRDKRMDFRIPEGVVCTHPSNQQGKDRFKSYSQTCEFWESDKED